MPNIYNQMEELVSRRLAQPPVRRNVGANLSPDEQAENEYWMSMHAPQVLSSQIRADVQREDIAARERTLGYEKTRAQFIEFTRAYDKRNKAIQDMLGKNRDKYMDNPDVVIAAMNQLSSLGKTIHSLAPSMGIPEEIAQDSYPEFVVGERGSSLNDLKFITAKEQRFHQKLRREQAKQKELNKRMGTQDKMVSGSLDPMVHEDIDDVRANMIVGALSRLGGQIAELGRDDVDKAANSIIDATEGKPEDRLRQLNDLVQKYKRPGVDVDFAIGQGTARTTADRISGFIGDVRGNLLKPTQEDQGAMPAVPGPGPRVGEQGPEVSGIAPQVEDDKLKNVLNRFIESMPEVPGALGDIGKTLTAREKAGDKRFMAFPREVVEQLANQLPSGIGTEASPEAVFDPAEFTDELRERINNLIQNVPGGPSELMDIGKTLTAREKAGKREIGALPREIVRRIIGSGTKGLDLARYRKTRKK